MQEERTLAPGETQTAGTLVAAKHHDHVWATIRRDAEEVSFMANTVLAVVAVIALVAAFKQSAHARKARMFEAFDRVQAKWDRPEIESAKAALFALEKEFVGAGGPASVPEGIASTLASLRQTDRDAYGSYWALICLLEEIGLLCRSGYLAAEDVQNSIGTSLGACISLLIQHVAWRRREVDKLPTAWANLIWLHETLPTIAPRTVAGYGL